MSEQRTSKSKTFSKGEDFAELMEWVQHNVLIETHVVEEGNPADHTEVIDHKYIITITKIESHE